jgi:hypothetical protein
MKWNPSFGDQMQDEEQLKQLVDRGMHAIVRGTRTPVPKRQLDEAARMLFVHDRLYVVASAKYEYKELYAEKGVQGVPHPDNLVRAIHNHMPSAFMYPRFSETLYRSLMSVVRANYNRAASRIQTAFRQARNDPYTPLGRRTVLRRAGFDPGNRRVMTAARRGVRAAPRGSSR